MRTKLTIILAMVLILALVLPGCRTRQGAEKTPELPKIPDKISRGRGKEPELVVYEVESGQRKKMKLEDYVAGVVAGEMENNWPVEALAAQAILARTYVLEFVQDKGTSKYGNAHISTDFEEAQAWNPGKINDKVKKAVEMTRGEVITYKGNFVKAWFHSHAGGLTATAKEGLNYKEKEPPYIAVIKSPDENAGPEGKRIWKAVFGKNEVRRLLKEKLGQDTGEINEVSVVERGPSGRATKIKIGSAVVHAADLRTALDPMRMRSTLLTSLRIEQDKIVMEGKGFGHGVGMSQWGARVLAQQGKSPEDIIRYYFKDVDVVKLWD
ncbi:MAG: stage sporulation protein [Tepidanaerobacteraceae bacterium]|nr:stage sporulation protein [Tepidanaerobacteraceae bacterium]